MCKKERITVVKDLHCGQMREEEFQRFHMETLKGTMFPWDAGKSSKKAPN